MKMTSVIVLINYRDPLFVLLWEQQWELLVLDVLQWELSAVTAYSVLDQILRTFELAGGHTAGTKDVNFVDGNNDDNVPSPGGASLQMETVRKHAETFVALASTEHSFSRKSPAVVAVACFGSALRGLNAQGLDGILEHLYVTTGVETVRAERPRPLNSFRRNHGRCGIFQSAINRPLFWDGGAIVVVVVVNQSRSWAFIHFSVFFLHE